MSLHLLKVTGEGRLFGAPRSRLNAIGTGILSVSLLAGVVALAARSQGFEETAIDLHEAGVWVSHQRHIARFNLQIDEFEVSRDASAGDDVVQSALDVAKISPEEMIRIDPVAGEPSDPVEGPGEVHATIGGTTAMVVDQANGVVWAMAPAQLGLTPTVDPETALFEASGTNKRMVATVDSAGVIHAYQEGTKEVLSFAAGSLGGGAAPEPIRTPLISAVDVPQIAAIGTRVVLLDQASNELVIVQGPTFSLLEYGDDLQLQLDGPTADSVVVAGGGKLIEVPVVGGEPIVVSQEGGSGPIRPVRARGCAWAAFTEQARWARTCEATNSSDGRSQLESVRMEDIPKIEDGANLAFRVNRERVVLNEVETGMVVTVDKPDVEAIEWEDPEKPVAPPTSQPTTTTPQDAEDDACGVGGPQAPEAVADQAGTRPGQPVIVRVLDNDTADDCDALSIKLPEQGAIEGTVAVVANHTAIQVSPDATKTSGEIVVQYEAVSARGAASDRTTLTVSINPVGEHNPPVGVADRTITAPDQTLNYNVLLNDFDPDGDPLKLVGVQPLGGAAPVDFRADGTVTFKATGAAVGPHKYAYEIEDAYGIPSEEPTTLDIMVVDQSQPPDARADLLVMATGKVGSINLLDNDTDPDTDHSKLRLAEVTGASGGLTVEREADGNVTVEASRADTYNLSYKVTDGTGEVGEGLFVVRVEDRRSNSKPVAVLDTVYVRPNSPTLVNVIGNDIDADGDVLAVTGFGDPPLGDVSVELLDMRMLRVVASQNFEPFTITYDLTDGTDSTTGAVIVLPYDVAIPNQRPVANDDDISVRADRWTSVNVVSNDVDPEGERLSLNDAVIVQPEGSNFGDVFIQGDHLRFRADPGGPLTIEVSYTISDPARETDSGTLLVRVKSDEAPNEPPLPVHLEARVYAGEWVIIPVPLIGADPDGDVVGIVGVNPAKPPAKGDVTRVAEGLRYQADAGAEGADSFQFTITDGQNPANGDSTVRVVIAQRPKTAYPPTAVPDEVTVKAGTAGRFIDVRANDTDPEDGEITLLTGADEPRVLLPDRGTAIVKDGQIWYEPPESIAEPLEWVGITYKIADPGNLRDDGMVRVRLLRQDSGLEVPPVAIDDAAARLLLHHDSIDIDVTKNDYDPDDPDKTFKVELAPPQGADWTAVPLGEGKFRFTVGTTSVLARYTITDERSSASALVSITVVETLPPVATLDEGYEVRSGDPAGVLIPVLDNDEPRGEVKLEAVLDNTFAFGTARIEGNAVRFTGEAATRVEGGFSYVISAGGQTAVGRARIVVESSANSDDEAENTPPEFLRTTEQVVQATRPPFTLELTEFVHDAENDPLTFTAAVSAAGEEAGLRAHIQGRSTLVLSATDAASEATATVVLTVSDGVNPQPISGTISVRIEPDRGPDAPQANPDPFTMREGTLASSIPVIGNDVLDLRTDLTLKHVVSEPVVVDASGRGTPGVGCNGTCLTYDAAEGDRLVKVRYTLGDTYKRADGSSPEGRTSQAVVTITVYGRPGTPGPPKGQMRSSSVKLNWDAAPGNGLPVLGYVVKIEAVDGGLTTTVPAPAAEADVTDLDNGKAYRFRVAAWNSEFGVGDIRDQDWSDWSAEITPDERPGAPTDVRVSFNPDQAMNNGGQGGILYVTWGNTPNEGSQIQTFEVQSSQGQSEIVSWPQTSASFNGLTNGSDYSFQVRAKNELPDWSEWSYSSNIEHPTGVPTVPTGVALRQGSPESTSLAAGFIDFTHNDPRARSDDDLRFLLSSSPSGPQFSEPFTAGAVVTNMTPGQDYTFTVTPRNRAGAGPAASSAPTRAYAKASPPTAPTAVSSDFNVMSISWARSADGAGGQSSRYRVIRYNEGGSEVERREVSGTSTTFAAIPEAGYTFGVVAISPRPGGDPQYDSAESPRTAVVIHYGRPDVQAAGTRTASGTGRQTAVAWTWSQQRAVSSYGATVTNHGSIPYTCDGSTCTAVFQGGFGGPRTYSITVTANGPNPSYKPASGAVASSATEDTRSEGIHASGSAEGETTTYPPGIACSSSCTWKRVWVEGYAPGTYTMTPGTNMADAPGLPLNCGECMIPYRVQVFSVDESGSWDDGQAFFQGLGNGGTTMASSWAWICPGSYPGGASGGGCRKTAVIND